MTEIALTAFSEPMPAHGGQIEGVSPLAGHLGLSSLLVREAVQNAWDARDDKRGGPVTFEIQGRDLDTDALADLRALLPVENLEGFDRTSRSRNERGVLHPNAVITADAVEVLVLADRNTVGLCGPTRSGTQWDPIRHGQPLARGQQRFANFIRNVGRATSDTGEGDGGAYGIGKTALWLASECGTILVHSRTTDETGKPVERFIGSVHGEHFYSAGREFTGRHFIGRATGDDIIEPLEGAQAAEAARRLPLPSYEVNGRPTDGTSIVIIAPKFQLGWKVEMDRLRDAVRWQVWPKRVPGVRERSDGPDMEIRLGWNNHTVDLPEPLEDPEVRPYAKALLDCARDRNADEDNRDFVAQCRSPKKVLGAVRFRSAGTNDQNVFHITRTADELAEVAATIAPEGEVVDDEPAVDFSSPWGQIALVRREPLLLVRYEPIGGPDAAATEIGVFLSADDPEVEAALTKAEPPAHDDWIHRLVPKDHPRDHRRTFAKRTVEEVKQARSKLIATYRAPDAGERGGGEQIVSRRLSDGLFGGLGGGKAPKSPTAGGSRTLKPRAQLSLVRTDQENDTTVHEVEVALAGLGHNPAAVTLVAGGSGFDNAGAMSLDEHISFSWLTSDGADTLGKTLDLIASDGTNVSLLVRVESNIRFRPKVLVEVRDDA